jgi:N-acyl-L-homoserine lactone synthetase
MPEKLSATLTTSVVNPDLVSAYGIFRRNLFIKHLGWDLCEVDGEERDQFDDQYAVYGILAEGDQVVGGFRALNSSRPYLAQMVFPHLAANRRYPVSSEAWEITRFGILPERSELARVAYALMFRFGFYRNARSFIAIADLTYERYLSAAGIRTERYGPPMTIPHAPGKAPLTIVAGEIPLDQQKGVRFHRLVSALNNVEIADETLVLGSASISA